MSKVQPERWRPLARYDGLYEVSSHGRVRHRFSRKSHPSRWDRCLSMRVVETSGYLQVCVYYDHQRKYPYVHSLVAEAFLGDRPSGHVVGHKDDNKLNNCVENLEYLTPSQNTLNAFRTGRCLPNRGERSGSTPLTHVDVREIKSRRLESSRVLGEEFGVSRSTIDNIKRGRTWAHVS